MATNSYNSTLKDILRGNVSDVLIHYRKDKTDSEENKKIYEQFDKDFSLYLDKLPKNNIKKYVSEVFNRELVTIGQNKITKGVSLGFVKIVTLDNSGNILKAINLDTKEFGISLKTGETNSIDDCIYATYFGFTRFAVVANRTSIKKNSELQQMLAQYLYQIFMSIIDTKKVDTPKQKFYIKMLSYYIFYRHYILETSAATIKILRNIFKNEKELIDEFFPMFKNIEKYTSVKDFAKILIDCHIIPIDPNIFSISLLKKYKQHAFYCIYGSLDMFIAFTIITKYPFEMFANTPIVNKSIQNDVEEIMVKYMRKIKFG
jgi:hypothetical protein